MNIENILKSSTSDIIKSVYGIELDNDVILIQKTRKDFEGDYTINVFPFIKQIKKTPEIVANEIGKNLQSDMGIIKSFNVIKGFLNLSIDDKFWYSFLYNVNKPTATSSGKKNNIMIEFSSPNTNKPLHLGHIRNNLIGDSIFRILQAAGNNVIKVNLINDRGIHICKSMIAWQKWGNGITPEKANIKGDKLVGDFYVKFDSEYKKQIQELIKSGKTKEIASKEAPLIIEAQEMLRKWEKGDKEIIELWRMMNNWVYKGFDKTYKILGISFDKIYYESETYKDGKKIVTEGLKNNILFKKEDNSVWANLSGLKLDDKLLLRADGTSVYMTQDIGTAHRRFTEHKIDKHIYVVGNEQNHHFKILKIILKKLGYKWADNIFHLSYGMVELPQGKMKSREGTVVDADDLIEEMIKTAKTTAAELGKLDGLSDNQKNETYKKIAIAALKYFILKVDTKKNMLFNPEESIDFNGNTGPFIQYTYVRILSVKAKAEQLKIKPENNFEGISLNKAETYLIKLLYEYHDIIKQACNTLSPSVIANYAYELSKGFNKFYHDFPILKENNKKLRDMRITLSLSVAETIKKSMQLLGVEMPDKM